MQTRHVDLLVCPKTQRPLQLTDARMGANARVEQGQLVEPVSGNHYPIVDCIPRFVESANYARTFGFEWNVHDRTQYDDYSGFSGSRHRFEKETRWGRDLRGQVILEAGSGSGRFTRPALETGAMVVSFDYSEAVSANYRSNGTRENLLLVQASVFEMPFRREFFDKAFCFGMLQHTPDPRQAFMSIVDHIKPDGDIASDVYAKDLIHWALDTKYWVRPFTRGQDPEKLYEALKRYVEVMWPLARLIRKIPRIGVAINWRLLVADHSKWMPNAPDATLKEWAYLDTFDMLSPAYDQPQTARTFRRWHEEAGLIDVDVHYGFNGFEGRGKKAPAAFAAGT